MAGQIADAIGWCEISCALAAREAVEVRCK